ncbi:MAG TPA: aminotransferase class III-fold pyridoxal phosphate-dependent enzyme [Solirubrobacteraceae bacterium]|nr:aminotransferase class III-fold pyridoxal phosphate-dependent enzyme [Solirubrobacteraceae bacterium]
MTDTASHEKVRALDSDLRRRAAAVIPGGMYGHMTVGYLPAAHPQFYERSEGTRVWDVDGNEYVDFMCAFGPMILGYKHPAVEAAAQAQREKGDTQPGPAASMVDLAELLVERIEHADWAIFAKNGTDATTVSLMVARAHTGRNKILAATGAYHGSAPWANFRLDGIAPEERANLHYYEFNDAASVERAVDEAGADDIAAIIASPFKHNAGFDQEEVDPDFAHRLRAICDELGAALVMDEVRTGFRLNHGGSWEPLGVNPDLSAWSKAIANGYPIAAILGSRSYAEAASRLFVTGSFWFQAVPMAASVATIHALRDEDAVATMERVGNRLRDEFEDLARSSGVEICQTGPVQMPNLSFPGDNEFVKARAFSAAMLERGVIVHPRHNWFLSAAHGDADVDRFLDAAEDGLRAVLESG